MPLVYHRMVRRSHQRKSKQTANHLNHGLSPQPFQRGREFLNTDWPGLRECAMVTVQLSALQNLNFFKSFFFFCFLEDKGSLSFLNSSNSQHLSFPFSKLPPAFSLLKGLSLPLSIIFFGNNYLFRFPALPYHLIGFGSLAI